MHDIFKALFLMYRYLYLQNIRRKSLMIFTVMLCALFFSSCEDEDAPNEFVGSWELVAVNSYSIYPDEYTTYDFWQNGTGSYGFYDYYGGWYNEPISWSVSYDRNGYTLLYVNSSQGYFSYEVSYISPNTMILVDLDTNNQLEYQRF